MAKKFYYCPKCKKYPNEVKINKSVTEERVWDGECYELIYDNADDNEEVHCGECGGLIIEE